MAAADASPVAVIASRVLRSPKRSGGAAQRRRGNLGLVRILAAASVVVPLASGIYSVGLMLWPASAIRRPGGRRMSLTGGARS